MNITIQNEPEGLNELLYTLYYIADVDDEAISSKLKADFKKNYSTKELQTYLAATEWALNHKEHDFCNRLPSLRKTNDQAILFLSKCHDAITEILNESA